MTLAAWVSSGLLRNYPFPFLCCFSLLGTHWLQKVRCQLTWKTHFLCGEFKVQPAHWGLNFTLQLQSSSTEIATILSFLCLVLFLSVLHFFFLNYFRYRHADVLGHPASQELRSTQNISTGLQARHTFPKSRKIQKPLSGHPELPDLYSRMAEKRGQAW